MTSGWSRSILDKLVASDAVVALDFVLKPLLALDSTVELVIDDGDAGGDLHDSRTWAWVSLVASGVIFASDVSRRPIAGDCRGCPMKGYVSVSGSRTNLSILKLAMCRPTR